MAQLGSQWRSEFSEIFIDMENEIQDLDHQIQLVTQELAYEKDGQKKADLSRRIQKLKLQREIATIRKRIEALSS